MPIIDYLVGLGSGILFSVVTLYFSGHKTVDNKKADCDQKLVQTVTSLAPTIVKNNRVDDADKEKLYKILGVYNFSESRFNDAWKTGLAGGVLFLISAACEQLGVTLGGAPLSWLFAYFGTALLAGFVYSLWHLMSTLREPV